MEEASITILLERPTYQVCLLQNMYSHNRIDKTSRVCKSISRNLEYASGRQFFNIGHNRADDSLYQENFRADDIMIVSK